MITIKLYLFIPGKISDVVKQNIGTCTGAYNYRQLPVSSNEPFYEIVNITKEQIMLGTCFPLVCGKCIVYVQNTKAFIRNIMFYSHAHNTGSPL